MDIRKVKKLIELLESSGVAEIEISEGEESVRISRYGQAAPPVVQTYPPAAALAPGAARPDAAAPAAAATPAAPPEPEGHEIKAPMVGTFYASATPGGQPFVEIGATVEKGQTLCIIEAMKMMNQIEADVSGRIVRVLVENGNPVEFGQTLFVIEQRS
jgi:acetyl-CoA carboxylase biotin carboxyl carrier protein